MKTEPIKMEEEARRVLARLEEAGYAAFFVGGFVRDKVGGREIHDIDLASSAPPEKALELFPGALPTGLKHGTITVRQGGFSFELTTFRKESEYEAFRRPAGVEFVSEVEEDLRRRDFTINAMAMDRRGELFDPFNGADDLRKGILKAVGEPDLRFREDALRMMRCVRFAANYGLQVDPETWLALLANARLLRHIAMERVRSELARMVEGPHPEEGLKLLADSRLLRHTKERLDFPLAEWTANELPAAVLSLGRTIPENRWLVLAKAMNLGSPDAERLWRILTFPQKEGKRVAAYLGFDAFLRRELAAAADSGRGECGECGDSLEPPNRGASPEEAAPLLFKRAVLLFGEPAALDWLRTSSYYNREAGSPLWPEAILQPAADWLIREGDGLLRGMPVKRMEELAVGGEELQAALNRAGGPWLGRLMRRLVEEVACGLLPNDKERLVACAKERADEA